MYKQPRLFIMSSLPKFKLPKLLSCFIFIQKNRQYCLSAISNLTTSCLRVMGEAKPIRGD